MNRNVVLLSILFIVIGITGFYWYNNQNTAIISPGTIEDEPDTTLVIDTHEVEPLSPITLDSIFDNKLNYNSEKDTLLIATGDVMLGRMINKNSTDAKDFNWAYKNIPNFFDEKAIVFINLENPLVENCPINMGGMIFCGSLKHAEYLKKNNIDIVSLANNHSLNHGADGIVQTGLALDEAGVKYTGVKNPTIIDDKNNKLVFLGFDDLECNQNYIECIGRENIISDIKEAKKIPNAYVIPMFHWGTEYKHKAHSGQEELARLAIDNGADLVLGNHPHWYQNLEVYKGKLIAYSHGNFIFDQMWSDETKEGIVGKYVISNGQLKDVQFVPIYIQNYGQPELADSLRAEKILNNLYNISQDD